MYIIISYDIPNDRRRTKIHDALKDYGAWVQYSVFECDLTKKEFLKLRQRLKELLSDDEGESIRFYVLCEECQKNIERIGGEIPPQYSGAVIAKKR